MSIAVQCSNQVARFLLHIADPVVADTQIALGFPTARVSLGELDAADLNVRSGDEIQTLAESLARMRKSMVQALQLLGG